VNVKKVKRHIIRKPLGSIRGGKEKRRQRLHVAPLPGLEESLSVREDEDRTTLCILMILDQFNVGGTETHTLTLARELLRRGVKVVLAGKKGRLLDPFVGLGCPYYEIDFVLDNFHADKENESRNASLLESIIAAEGVNLVHAHQYPSGQAALLAARKMNIPFVFTIHGAYYDTEILNLFDSCSALISVSPYIHKRLMSLGIANELIPNGIEVQHFAPSGSYPFAHRLYIRNKLELPAEAKVVLYASRLAWEKADICAQVIRSVEALRKSGRTDLQLIVAGGGRRESEIRELADACNAEEGGPYIRLLGEVVDIRTCFNASDLVIGTGRIALEAMNCERLLIAAGTRGLLGIVRPQLYERAWNGWFGDHDAEQTITEESLCATMTEALDMQETEKQRIVRIGAEHIARIYSISLVALQTIRLYQRLTGRQIRRGGVISEAQL
jgi:L-malate glycosyltransferase